MTIELHTMADWYAFSTSNYCSLMRIYPSMDAALTAALQGGIALDGPDGPEVFVAFVD